MFIPNLTYLEAFKNSLYFAIYEEYGGPGGVLSSRRVKDYTLVKSVIFYKITGQYLPEDPYNGRFNYNPLMPKNGLFYSIKVDEKYIKSYKNYRKVVHTLKNYLDCDFLLKALDNNWVFNIISSNGFVTKFYVVEDEYKQTYIRLEETEKLILCNDIEIGKSWIDPKELVANYIEKYINNNF